MRFLTPIYHPNIDLEGNVCLNILRADWTPVNDVNTVVYGLIFLFDEPNGNDPLNQEASKQWRDDREGFARTVAKSLAGKPFTVVEYNSQPQRRITLQFPRMK